MYTLIPTRATQVENQKKDEIEQLRAKLAEWESKKGAQDSQQDALRKELEAVIYVYIYVCVCVCVFTYIYMCVCVCVCVIICVCVCVLYINTYVRT